MHMDEGMDTGAVVDQLAFKIAFDWTSQDLITAIQKHWPDFLNDTLWSYAKVEIREQIQDDTLASYCQKIEKSDGAIELEKDSLWTIYAKYRAYQLWPKTYFFRQEKQVTIENLILDPVSFEAHQEQNLRDQDFNLNPAIVAISLKPEGKKAMNFQSFKNGYLK